MRAVNVFLMALALVVAGSLIAFAEGEQKAKGEKEKKPFYPFTTCPVDARDSVSDPVEFEVDGREVRTCSVGCKAKVLKDSKKWLNKLDGMAIAEQDEHYPLMECPVSGKELGDKPMKITEGNYLVKLCSAGCEKKFKKDPRATITELSEFWYDKALDDVLDAIMSDDKPNGNWGGSLWDKNKQDK